MFIIKIRSVVLVTVLALAIGIGISAEALFAPASVLVMIAKTEIDSLPPPLRFSV